MVRSIAFTLNSTNLYSAGKIDRFTWTHASVACIFVNAASCFTDPQSIYDWLCDGREIFYFPRNLSEISKAYICIVIRSVKYDDRIRSISRIYRGRCIRCVVNLYTRKRMQIAESMRNTKKVETRGNEAKVQQRYTQVHRKGARVKSEDMTAKSDRDK